MGQRVSAWAQIKRKTRKFLLSPETTTIAFLELLAFLPPVVQLWWQIVGIDM
jgi:hypothetical protein